jgi:hypothetical protein
MRVSRGGGGSAASIAFTPAGTIAANTVQGAVEEVAGEAGAAGISKLTLSSDATTVVGVSFADAAAGLDIAVTNGVAVRFQYVIFWIADATTTGAKFGLNGPAFTRLAAIYEIAVPGLATYSTLIDAYNDEDPTVGTTSNATSNLSIIRGVLVPSASGTLALRSRAEVASPGAVTVKAGSSVLYW